jgi:guanylate kinase
MKGILFIISSPSGGGKGTLIKEVLQTVANIGYSVSSTTRPMRDGEENGRQYFFLSRAEFEERIRQGDFLEYAEVHGNYYGTSKKQVEEMTNRGIDVILEIDVQGAEIIREQVDQVSVFILPPSYEVLRQRLISRQTDSMEVISLRLENAKEEVERFIEFDYVIINDQLEKAVSDLRVAILAQRLRKERQEDLVRNVLVTFDNFNTVGD